MYIVDRSLQFVRGALLSYGPRALRRRVWDAEYRNEKWKFAYNTVGDCVYGHLEKFARKGSILDLGCGSGNTATEMADSSYERYVGVDISEAALEKARRRSAEIGRQNKNTFACSDFLAYQPQGKFDVILFRESMYHVPMTKIKVVLDYYAPYLKEDGVFIVRLFTGSRENTEQKHRPTAMMGIIEDEFDVVENARYTTAGLPQVIVFRPKAMVAATAR
jgi:2-polyprenyl-3-methyl-5-hydroxy-6-metoxy-1,4-benzoquinol methylase